MKIWHYTVCYILIASANFWNEIIKENGGIEVT